MLLFFILKCKGFFPNKNYAGRALKKIFAWKFFLRKVFHKPLNKSVENNRRQTETFPFCDKPGVHAPTSAVYRFASSILSFKQAPRRKNRLSFQEIHLKISTQNEAGCVGNCVEFPNFFLYPLFLSDLIIEALSSHYLDIRSQAKRWRNLCTSFYYCHPAHFEPRRTEIVGKSFGDGDVGRE